MFFLKYARNIHIGMAVLVEWLILLILLVFWIPKIEGSNLESIGFGKFRRISLGRCFDLSHTYGSLDR